MKHDDNLHAEPVNRSMPSSVVIPELAYPDVRAAADWLCRVFGFVERLQIGSHRAQLTFGSGAVIVTRLSGESSGDSGSRSHSVMVRVANVDEHYQRATQSGARIINPPTDYPFGERQYSVDDIGGHRWTFSQTIADSDPGSWGGILLEEV